MALAFDHLVVVSATLDEGAAWVAERLDVVPGPGGRHAAFATHNRLLRLGPGEYLEVIAPDPDAPAPPRPRWFGLDAIAGPPRLAHWVVRTGDPDVALARTPQAGPVIALERGRYRWRMGVPADGRLPFDGLHPAFIAWDGPHPAAALPEAGLRLDRLTLHHPEAAALADRVPIGDPRVAFEAGPAGLSAVIVTPAGAVTLA